MTQRENFLSLMRRQGYAYAPVDLCLCPSLVETFQQRTGGTVSWEEYAPSPLRAVNGPAFVERQVDWRQYYPDGLHEGAVIDPVYGIAQEPGSAEAYHTMHMRHPLENMEAIEELLAYPFPVYRTDSAAQMAVQAADIHAQGYVSTGHVTPTVWEIAWYLRSMPQLMMDMADGNEMATRLLDTLTEISCLRAMAYAEAGVDLLLYGDDIGMQSALMMAPEFYREWLKPRLTKAIAAAKSIKPDMLVMYHSCGYIRPLIPDLIDAGIDILNPVQPECMDFVDVHAAFGDRLSFWGTIGTQTTMPFGTPEDVRREVWRNLDIAGSQGGLFCTPTHLLEPEVPWENIDAYLTACREYRMG